MPGRANKANRALRVLVVEDSQKDADLLIAELRRHGYAPHTRRVQDPAELLAALREEPWDAVLSDYSMPQFLATDALRLVQEKGLDIPFIIVSGTIGEDTAIEAMKAGAHDYMMKERLTRLVPALERELREATVRRARRNAEAVLRFQARLLDSVGEAVIATDLRGSITYWNRYAETLYGWHAREALGQNLVALTVPESSRKVAAEILRQLQSGKSWFGESIIRRRDGTILTALVANTPIYEPVDRMVGVIGISTDVTTRKQAETELRDSREQLRALAARLQSTREEERKTIARDMHDDLGQTLTGLKIDVDWLRSRLAKNGILSRQALLDKLAAMSRVIEATSDTVRDLCSKLRPGILDDLGLVAAVKWQAREFAAKTGIQCEVLAPADELTLDSNLSAAIFRIFQEILTNIVRHARATKVSVLLRSDRDNLLLEVSDNGRGIRQTDLIASKSLGLLGMRERALALGGEIGFLPGATLGTTVTLRVPMPGTLA